MNREQLLRLVNFIFRRLTTTTFTGTEHIPPEGGFIMATNHISRLDTPVLFINPVRRDMTALVADKYQPLLVVCGPRGPAARCREPFCSPRIRGTAGHGFP